MEVEEEGERAVTKKVLIQLCAISSGRRAVLGRSRARARADMARDGEVPVELCAISSGCKTMPRRSRARAEMARDGEVLVQLCAIGSKFKCNAERWKRKENVLEPGSF